MPALSNGNTCWGNRKAFNMCTEYISDSFLLGIEMQHDEVVRPQFISTDQYYSYHRIPDKQAEEEMVTEESNCFDVNVCEPLDVSCRKRPIPAEQNVNVVKRVRHLEPRQHSFSADTLRKSQPHSPGFCLL